MFKSKEEMLVPAAASGGQLATLICCNGKLETCSFPHGQGIAAPHAVFEEPILVASPKNLVQGFKRGCCLEALTYLRNSKKHGTFVTLGILELAKTLSQTGPEAY